MPKKIEPMLKKIGEYLELGDSAFVIPEYQRAYSWGIDNCDKLWQDINEFIEAKNKDSYFFGTIILSCENNDRELALIDGQQRTTTFLLLLKALLIGINDAINKTKNDDESENLCRGLEARRRAIMKILYKAQDEDISYHPNLEEDSVIYSKPSILKNYSINELDLYKTEIQTILKSVDMDEIKNSVVTKPYKQKDNKYTNFFRNFKYFEEKIRTLSASELNVLTKTFLEMCHIIEIRTWDEGQAIMMFNSLNSDGLPLYDADIIASRLYAYAEDREDFNTKWQYLLNIVENLQASKIATIDSLLLQHMYHERAKNKDIVTDTGGVDVTTPGVRRYFTKLNNDILRSPIELCDKMTTLAKIWQAVSKYPVMQVLSKFNENSKLFLASYFYRFTADEVSEEKLKTIMECMLRLFAILELIDTGYSSAKFKSFLFKEEVLLVDPNIPENKIKEDFDNHINTWKRDELKELIVDYDKNSLVYLNEYLFAKYNKLSFNLGTKYDIEHIMPNSGKNLPGIRLDAGMSNEDEFNEYVNKIGNKIVLEEPINRGIGNEWFSMKVSTKLEDKTGYINSSFPIASTLVKKYKDISKPYWKKEDIKNATEKASERILKFIFDEDDTNDSGFENKP